MSILLFLLVLYGIYLALEAMVLTAEADVWKGTMKMTIIALILTLCAGYIYLTKDVSFLIH